MDASCRNARVPARVASAVSNTAKDITGHRATVVVIGAGQAGLSAGYHLKQRGFVDAGGDAGGSAAAASAPSFVVLDANPGPGGAWQHRWESLRMATVNGIFDLPRFPKPPIDSTEPSRTAVPRYFAAFEAATGLPIERQVRVTAVSPVDNEPDGDLVVETDSGQWIARAVINATGTWNNPLQPQYPGQDSFTGRQLHARDYGDAAEFAGQRVAIVGGGISAVQQLEEISRQATTLWYTRREPVFFDGEFEPETTGRETIAKVMADVEAGLPSRSIVSYTGLGWSAYARAAKARGALERRPMFTRIEPTGVVEADGSFTSVDAILWATGFRPDVAHLDPLGLRNGHGGIQVRNTEAMADPRIHLIGFGPSQSTVGANRAGRDAVAALARRYLVT